MYREEESGASFMMGVLTGAFVGAGIALLFAPRPGNEMRERLGEQYRGLADRVSERTESLRTAADQLRTQGMERVQQMSAGLSDRASSGSRSTADDADRFPSSAPSV